MARAWAIPNRNSRYTSAEPASAPRLDTNETAEAAWGADPLESLGGFHALQFKGSDRFASSLAVNAGVGWSPVATEPAASAMRASLQLDVNFPEIDWPFAQSVYGWAALQYQAWARGYIVNHRSTTRRVTLYTDHILELWINDDHFFGGDFYAFRRAPIVLTLDPGKNVVDIRLL